jgi:SET and MYND domain-containing protein
MLLLARLLDLAHADASANTDEAAAWPSSIGATLCLSSHLDKLSPTRAQEFAAQAAMLRGLLAEAQPERPAPPPELATRLLATLACNGHTLSDDELQPLGLGLYPLAALTNHDCNPSAVHCFEGTTLMTSDCLPPHSDDV